MQYSCRFENGWKGLTSILSAPELSVCTGDLVRRPQPSLFRNLVNRIACITLAPLQVYVAQLFLHCALTVQRV